MIWKGGESKMATTPPHDISDKEVIDYMPSGEGSKTIVKLMSDSQIFLKDHPVNIDREKRGLFPRTASGCGGRARGPPSRPFTRNTG